MRTPAITSSADVRFRRPWLLEVDYANGQRGAHCYVCELGRWWWDPNKRARFVWVHRGCGFADPVPRHGSDLADLRPRW